MGNDKRMVATYNGQEVAKKEGRRSMKSSELDSQEFLNGVAFAMQLPQGETLKSSYDDDYTEAGEENLDTLEVRWSASIEINGKKYLSNVGTVEELYECEYFLEGYYAVYEEFRKTPISHYGVLRGINSTLIIAGGSILLENSITEGKVAYSNGEITIIWEYSTIKKDWIHSQFESKEVFKKGSHLRMTNEALVEVSNETLQKEESLVLKIELEKKIKTVSDNLSRLKEQLKELNK
jgi:hypothetical protein|tara:strand:- start:308 stop:1015 length:708 start_codon:yes stop_codon:yes gene_type:complete